MYSCNIFCIVPFIRRKLLATLSGYQCLIATNVAAVMAMETVRKLCNINGTNNARERYQNAIQKVELIEGQGY